MEYADKHANRRAARTLGQALAVSLALHAMLLLQDGDAARDGRAARATSTSAPSSALNAVLHGGSAAPEPPAPHAAPSPEPSPASQPAPLMGRAVAMPSAMTSAFPAGSSVSTGGATAVANAPNQPNQPNQPDTSPSSNIPVRPDQPQAPGAAVDGGGLRQYRVSLAIAAGRYRKPVETLAAGYRGTIEVQLTIAADGFPEAAQIRRSSGNTLLDAAVATMLDNAARMVALPASLQGRPFSIGMPVELGKNGDGDGGE